MQDILNSDNVVVLNPLSAGFHKKDLKILLDKTLQKIIYLSCNPSTFARDFSILKNKYKVEKIIGYDFYPNTYLLEVLGFLKASK